MRPGMHRVCSQALVVLLATLAVSSCAYTTKSNDLLQHQEVLARTRQAVPYPATRFMVFSDPHLYDGSRLGLDTKAAMQAVSRERKLLLESATILEGMVGTVLAAKPDFVLIPGDLTKDGELQNHLSLAEKLLPLYHAGIKVFVVPGNHDVLNPRARQFLPGKEVLTPGVSPAQFAQIYEHSGYGQALFRDTQSLSYVAEPVNGLWLLAIDSCDYRNNMASARARTGGYMNQQTVSWVESMLELANQRRKAVIIMQHHGIVEHFPAQARFMPQYLVDNWHEIGSMYAAWNVQFVFTGHFHANDVVMKSWNKDDYQARAALGRQLYDIETGSLVTYPVMYRSCEFSDNASLVINSKPLELPAIELPGGKTLVAYTREVFDENVRAVAKSTLQSLGLSQAEQSSLLDFAIAVVLKHYEGNEIPDNATQIPWEKLGLLSRLGLLVAGELVEGLQQDLYPADNDLTIQFPGR